MRGRKPIGDRAMTPAERQRRLRIVRRAERGMREVLRLAAAAAALERQLAENAPDEFTRKRHMRAAEERDREFLELSYRCPAHVTVAREEGDQMLAKWQREIDAACAEIDAALHELLAARAQKGRPSS